MLDTLSAILMRVSSCNRVTVFTTKLVTMERKKTITLASKPTYQGYSYGFKVAIVERIENGQLSINQAAKEYDVSRSGIQKWVKKYGNLDTCPPHYTLAGGKNLDLWEANHLNKKSQNLKRN
jgi:hypothetical protein